MQIFGPSAPQPIDFSWVGNLANDFYQGAQNKQNYDVSHAFKNGLPLDSNGAPDYGSIVQTLAKYGDVNAVKSLAPNIQRQIEQNTPVSPFFSGFGTPGGPAPTAQPSGGPPSSSTAPTYAPNQSAPSASQGAGEGATDASAMLHNFEGYRSTPYWDVNHWRVGYGSDTTTRPDGSVEPVTAFTRVTPADAQRDLDRRINIYQNTIRSEIGDDAWNNLTPESQAALTSVAYNYGHVPSRVMAAAESGNPQELASSISSLPANKGRRQQEASAVLGKFGLNGPEATTAPAQTYAMPSSAPQGLNIPPASAAASQPSGVSRGSTSAESAQGGESVAQIVEAELHNSPQAHQVAVNLARVLKVDDPTKALTPQQQAYAKRLLASYKQRTQSVRGEQGAAPTGGGRIMPQVPLPRGYNDPQRAMLAIDGEIARLSRIGGQEGQIAALKDYRDRIAASTMPMEVRPGQALIDPQNGQVIYQAPLAARLNANTMLMQKYFDEHPDATAEDFQKFLQSGKNGRDPEMVGHIASGIEDGRQSPELTGLYGMSGPIRAKLEEDGFDLAKAQLQWKAAQKQIQALNGPQMTRYAGLAGSVVNTIDEVKDLAEQMQNSGIPLFNRAKLQTYIQAEGNSENGQLAARYLGAVNTLKEEFANLAQGGYAPTEAAWKLADKQINENYGVKELGASLNEVQRLIRYRLNAIPNFTTMGPAGANRYTGNPGLAPSETAEPRAGAAPGGDRQSTPHVQTKQQYDALPRGTRYIAPDGSERVKQ